MSPDSRAGPFLGSVKKYWFFGEIFTSGSSFLHNSFHLVSKRGEAERLAEPPGCCLSWSGVTRVEFTFLWDFPKWILKPFLDLKMLSHWSHIKASSSRTFSTTCFSTVSSSEMSSLCKEPSTVETSSFKILKTYLFSWHLFSKQMEFPCSSSLWKPKLPSHWNPIFSDYIWIRYESIRRAQKCMFIQTLCIAFIDGLMDRQTHGMWKQG